MPSNHLLKDLPFVDEDGYFEGVCSVQMGGGISLPANVAEAAVPEDTEHFFYKLNATRDGFDAEKKRLPPSVLRVVLSRMNRRRLTAVSCANFSRN